MSRKGYNYTMSKKNHNYKTNTKSYNDILSINNRKSLADDVKR